jgi:hypothetical protein
MAIILVSYRAKATARFASNSAKLSKNLPKCKQLPDLVKNAVELLKVIIPALPDLVKDADTIGAPAYKADHYRPWEITKFHHPGPKKSEEELKKLEEEHNKLKCHCAKCSKAWEKRNAKPSK